LKTVLLLTNKSHPIKWLLRYFRHSSFKKMPADGRLTLKATPHNLGLLFNSSKFADSKQAVDAEQCVCLAG
jgi:hypothetical protein